MKKAPIRLQKYLSECGVCSRRVAEDLIRQQKVVVNGEVASLGDKVTGEETILVNGQKVQSAAKKETKVIAWYKPRGIEVTFRNEHGGQTLLHAPNYAEMKKYLDGRMIPSGRLDKESEGLLLLTNDGELANELMHPRYEHEKEYVVTVHKSITDQFLKHMSDGSIQLDGKSVMPCIVDTNYELPKTNIKTLLAQADNTFRIVLKEGRNRQIRKMCDALGYRVMSLKRIRMQNVKLGKLKEGDWKKVVPADLR